MMPSINAYTSLRATQNQPRVSQPVHFQSVETMPSIAEYGILDAGPLVPINLYTDHTQTESWVTVLDANKTVISWTSNAQDARYSTTATRTFSGDFEQGSDETFLDTNDIHARTVALPEYRYAMITDDKDNVNLRIFDENMTQITSTQQVNIFDMSYQEYPSMALTPNETLITAWDSRYQTGSYDDIFSREFYLNATPIASEFQVSQNSRNQEEKPTVSILSSGDRSYLWSCQDGSLFGVCGKVLDQNNTVKVSDYIINSYTSGSQLDSNQTPLNGKFAAVWIDKGRSGIYTKLVQDDGVLLTSDIKINEYPIDVQSRPAIKTLSDGNGYIIAYGSVQEDGYHAYIQIVDAKGALIGGNVQVNDEAQGWSSKPSLDIQPNGNVIVAFTGDDAYGSGIFAKLFTPIQSPAPTETPTTSVPTVYSTYAPTYLTQFPTYRPTLQPITSPTTVLERDTVKLDMYMILLITGLSLLACFCMCCCCARASR